MKTGKMLIDGEWVDASNGATYTVPNPATEELVGRAPDATADDMRRAIGAARRAFDDGPWSRSSRDDRARALLRIADAMERRKEEMRQLLIAEAGATWVTHPMQVDSPIEHLRHWADIVRGYEFEEMLPARASQGPMGPQMNCGVVCRQPVGVCAMIPTWNFPVYVTVQKLGPALATGCTMVFKPSPWGPLINLFIAELVAEADLPPGVVNFVTGQGCAMATRVLVQKDVHDRFVENMVGFVQNMVKVGDPADPATMLGPVIREERRQKIEEYIGAGKAEGATLASGGGRPKDLKRGYFLEPTIFCNVRNHIRIAREEIFGPVVSVIPFADDEEAIRIANDSTYGLGGAIYARDTTRAVEMAKRIRTGVVWINNGINMFDGPFGGFKESGIGREGGRWSMEEYTEVQQITWRA